MNDNKKKTFLTSWGPRSSLRIFFLDGEYRTIPYKSLETTTRDLTKQIFSNDAGIGLFLYRRFNDNDIGITSDVILNGFDLCTLIPMDISISEYIGSQGYGLNNQNFQIFIPFISKVKSLFLSKALHNYDKILQENKKNEEEEKKIDNNNNNNNNNKLKNVLSKSENDSDDDDSDDDGFGHGSIDIRKLIDDNEILKKELNRLRSKAKQESILRKNQQQKNIKIKARASVKNIPPQREIYRGWMYKKGTKNTAWQNRFFIFISKSKIQNNNTNKNDNDNINNNNLILEHILTYYKKATANNEAGHINFRDVIDITEGIPRNAQGIQIPTINLNTGNRIYHLCASSLDEHNHWIELFRNAINAKTNPNIAFHGTLAEEEIEISMENLDILTRLFDKFDNEYHLLLRSDSSSSLNEAEIKRQGIKKLYYEISHYYNEWEDILKQKILNSLLPLIRLPISDINLLNTIINITNNDDELKYAAIKEVKDGIKLHIKEDLDEINDEKSNNINNILLHCRDMLIRLDNIKKDLIPYFPSEYKILKIYCQETHKVICYVINKFLNISKELVNNDELLLLLEFQEEYEKKLESFGILHELDITFIEISEQLFNNYKLMILNLLNQWLDNIRNMENKEKLNNEIEIHINENGYKYTNGPNDLLQIITQQLNLAKTRLHDKKLCKISEIILISFQNYFEYKFNEYNNNNYINNLNNLELLVALLNNQKYSINGLINIKNNIINNMNIINKKEFINIINNILNNTKFSTDLIINKISNDIINEIKELLDIFFTNEWINNEYNMKCIIATLIDFFDELNEWFFPNYFILLFQSTLNKLEILYIEKLFLSNLCLDSLDKYASIKSDITLIYDGMKKYNIYINNQNNQYKDFKNILIDDDEKNNNNINNNLYDEILRPFVAVDKLINMPPNEIPNLIEEYLFEDYGNQTMEVVKGILCMHHELGPDLYKQIKLECREKELPTIKGKLDINVVVHNTRLSNKSFGGLKRNLIAKKDKFKERVSNSNSLNDGNNDDAILELNNEDEVDNDEDNDNENSKNNSKNNNTKKSMFSKLLHRKKK